MRMTRRICAMVAVIGLLSGMAFAVPTALTLTAPQDPPYTQQTENNPLILGHAPPHQPAGFSYTTVGSGGGGTDNLATSPVYSVSQIRDIVGDLFIVSIDLNQNGNINTPTQFLHYFDMKVNGTVEAIFGSLADPTSPSDGTPLQATNNGNGFSDAFIGDFDLSGFATTDEVTFTARWWDTDGFDQFWLTSLDPPPFIPEPATLCLVALGIAGGGMAGRRRKSLR